ncbi:bifunctional 2-polyprenyl-6-hydroxyphenol methylase/3-demethylubiquinol 3-O-methyltransferase UbiG [Mucilaginibacter sp. UR6-11]|uniref:class I SAM-dependent methyltransferase n=1 Tax=Mucilaginibacter sp. UR6-11 TaxID=1435644 RepID=UPI001E2AD5F7|nr:class I SAM-dependent methyltransferase [Mucilaginibacter sp. UR6-11]MCC8425720.1 class I SAM-dependent methyltransferase [Mucilaginibacter sp. UR6-11]
MKYRYTPYNAKCPICGNVDNLLLYEINSRDAASQFLVNQSLKEKKEAIDIVENSILKLWKAKTAAVVSCKNCGFGFADPFTGGDHEFYNLITHASETGIEPVPYQKWEFDRTFKEINVLTSEESGLTLLEIGASNGSFAKKIAELIDKKNIFCLEYSDTGVKFIKDIGIEAHSWNFRELKSKPEFCNRFNIICLFQVLEHLDNLKDTFETFNSIIKPGGHLFIGVPNSYKINFNELHNGLLDLPPNHVGRYNKNSFKILGQKYQWDLVDLDFESYSPLDVMKTVMYSRSLKKAQFPPVKRTLWYRVKEYLDIKFLQLQAFSKHKKLGETIWVHYKKPISTLL